MVIEALQTNSAAMRVNSRPAVLGVVVAPAELAVLVAREALAEPAAQVVREALAELAAQVAVAQVLVPAVEVPELAQAVEGLELVPVAAVRVLVPVVPPAKIKSATAAHHHGQVRVPKRAVVLAAVAAETMHAPAATEAVTAWAAAE